MTLTAFPGHAGRGWPLARWRSLARTASDVATLLTAFPGHAGRGWTSLAGARSLVLPRRCSDDSSPPPTTSSSSAWRSTWSWPTESKLFSASPEPVRRRAQHQHRSGDARPPRAPSPCSTGAPSSWRCASGWRSTAASSRACSTARTTSTRTCPRRTRCSQYDVPLNVDGSARPARRQPGRHRAGPSRRGHRQVDPTSEGPASGSTAATRSLIDFNRAGVPLVEIVQSPRPPQQRAGPSLRRRAAPDPPRHRRVRRQDGGGLDAGGRQRERCTVPASRTARGARSRTSTRSAPWAGHSRSAAPGRPHLPAADTVRQETRHWDETDGRTHTLRTKEDADDYRYFPEPDLVPLVPDVAWIEDLCRSSRATGPAWRSRLSVGDRPRRRTPRPSRSSSKRGQDDYVLALSSPLAATPGVPLVHVQQGYAEAGRRAELYRPQISLP